MEKRGISAIVATVLTILITVAGIAIIWVAVVPMINENIAFDELNGRVSISTTGGYTAYDVDKEVAIVQIKRDVDDGAMNRIKIIFMINGESVSSNVVAPESGQTKTYTFDLSEYDAPESVSAAPIFVSTSGKEKEGSVNSKVDMPSGKISEVDVDVLYLERDYFYDTPITGLVSWWKFDGDATDSFGENDGEDCSGYCPEFINNLVVFDGENDYVEVAEDASLDFTSELTISLWVKLNEENGGWASLINKQPKASSYYIMQRNTPRLSLALNTINGNNETSTNLLNLNQWYNIVGTYGGSEMRLYVNGNFSGSSLLTGDIRTTTGDLVIGSSYPGITEFFNGSIDDVMIYNKALTQEEITAIYENQMK